MLLLLPYAAEGYAHAKTAGNFSVALLFDCTIRLLAAT